MIKFKYPKEVEMALEALDRKIAQIYAEEPSYTIYSDDECLRKRNCYNAAKPYFDKKAEILENSNFCLVLTDDVLG